MENYTKGGERKTPQTSNTMGIVAIAVVGVFILCVIFVLAKGLFTSNDSKVLDGIYTGTISPEMSAAAAIKTEESKIDDSKDSSDSDDSSKVDDSTDSSDDENSSSDESSDSEEDSSSQSQVDGKTAYITEYAYLRTEASQDGAEIVCMSPNITVTVLETGINGYAKVTFVNGDGSTLTGYVHESYLSQTPIS